ncbi:hypothetical protein MKX01_004108 [Papaver californicum]|nr:hypothetical protein MKX01_004108 [Papaver californicum]
MRHYHGCGLTQQQQEKNYDGSDSAMMSFVLFDKQAQALYYADYHEDNIMEENPIYDKRRINLKFQGGKFGFVGSCNGLICLSNPTSYTPICLSRNYNRKLK